MRELLYLAILTISISAFAVQNSIASDQQSPVFSGNPNITLGKKGVFLSLTGPTLKLTTNDFEVGLGLYPTIRLHQGNLSPMLGTGPFLSWKKISLLTNFYSISGQWSPSFGLGYKL